MGYIFQESNIRRGFGARMVGIDSTFVREKKERLRTLDEPLGCDMVAILVKEEKRKELNQVFDSSTLLRKFRSDPWEVLWSTLPIRGAPISQEWACLTILVLSRSTQWKKSWRPPKHSVGFQSVTAGAFHQLHFLQ